MIGGLAAIIGSSTIFFAIYIGFLVLARGMNAVESVNPIGNTWPSFTQALIYFSAGFLSGWIVAPYILRRLLSQNYKRTGLVTTGFLFGGTTGLLCSWLAALIFISELTISGLWSGKTEETLLWSMKLFGYYASFSMLLFSSLAIVFGALWGSTAEWCYRRFLHKA